MTKNEQKQQLSIAYVHAVTARAGYALERVLVDIDSVDVTIAARGWLHDRSVYRSPRMDVQLKATSQDVLAEEFLAFPLSIKNYNELREPTLVPRLLAVLLLPADPQHWLEMNEEQLVCRRCVYWRSLLNEPATSNTETVTIHVPRSNIFDVVRLQQLLIQASQGEPLQ